MDIEGYEVGQKPPGLNEDGSFIIPMGGIRGTAFINDFGRILSVDRKTGLLIERDPNEE